MSSVLLVRQLLLDPRHKLMTEAKPQEPHHPAKKINKVLIGVVAVGMIAVVVVAIWFLRPNGNVGRPVPAPRSTGIDQTSNNGATTGEQILTINAEEAQRAGIKIETVGERISAEIARQPTTGVVQPNAYRETPIVSIVSGIVRSVGPELGQNVKKGHIVAVVFSNDLADAQSKYLAAVAELEEHHKHHAREEKLVEIGAASREELEMATSKLRSAESEVANVRQKLILLGLSSQRVAGLHSTSQVNSDVAIPAPVSGTLTSRTVNSGEVIAANKELMRVTDLSSVWVVGQVYEKDLALARVGNRATITSDTYPGRIFRGHVSYVDPKLDPQTRTAQVRVELANPSQQLKIGMYVNVAFAALRGSQTTMPMIPVAAVQNIGNQQMVFVPTRDSNAFAMHPVRLGPESNGYYSVLEGLNVGDRVVTGGSFMLRAEWLRSHPSP